MIEMISLAIAAIVLIGSVLSLYWARYQKGVADYYYVPARGKRQSYTVQMAPIRWVSAVIAVISLSAMIVLVFF